MRTSLLAGPLLVSRKNELTPLFTQWEDRNHLPDHGIRLLVGWTGQGRPMAVGPPHPRPDSNRFHLARALHHALFASAEGERLVTGAYTVDQQVARAFAAELLAPQQALSAQTGGCADPGMIEELARQFEAPTLVIERQLENAGVMVLDE